MYVLVDLNTEAVVSQRGISHLTFGSLRKVRLPDVDRSVVFNPEPGYVFPPQKVDEGEPAAPPPAYKLLQVTEVESGSGVVATVSDPVYDSDADTVTVTTTLRDNTSKEISDEKDKRATDIMTQDGLIAVLKCINDGSIVPGGEVSLGALKTAIRAQL
jgi:hypothetical protein